LLACLSRGEPHLRSPEDLARHVRLDFETILYGRLWYDWEHWFRALGLRPIRPAGTLRFSHYDQVVQSAVDGNGVAIGKWPHLAELVGGRLVDGEPPVVEIGDLDERIRAFHDVRQDLAFRQRLVLAGAPGSR